MRRTGVAVLMLAAGVLGLSGISGGAASPAGGQAFRAAGASGESTANLGGVARASGGNPLSGVVVSARQVGKSYTTSVVTDERGEYVFPPLEHGRYDVWAQAVGFEIARAHVSVEVARPARETFTLATIADVTPQLSGSEWLDALPEQTKEQRRMKAIFRTNCTACHGVTHALQNRFDENGWRAVIGFMERLTGTGGINRHTTVAHYKDELARYLASVRGPSSPPLTFKLQPRPSGDAARVVMTEYDIPLAGARDERAWNDGSDWSRGWPTASLGARWIHDIVPANDGNAWGTRDRGPADMTLFKIDVKSGQVSGFSVMNGKAIRRSHSIAKDRNGIIWFDGGDGALGRLDPATEAFRMFRPPLNMGGGQLTTLDIDGRGKIWGATQ
jgi:mono/diheme cytochrome c family protein